MDSQRVVVTEVNPGDCIRCLLLPLTKVHMAKLTCHLIGDIARSVSAVWCCGIKLQLYVNRGRHDSSSALPLIELV
jgi:hypothetical protein